MAKCFKCEKDIKCAVIDDNPMMVWEMPCGVVFSGGWNFGSTLYDAMLDGMKVEIIVCDDCMKAAGDDRKLEVQTDSGHYKSRAEPVVQGKVKKVIKYKTFSNYSDIAFNEAQEFINKIPQSDVVSINNKCSTFTHDTLSITVWYWEKT